MEVKPVSILENPFSKWPATEGRTRYARLGLIVVDVLQNMAREVIGSLIKADVLHRQIRRARRNIPELVMQREVETLKANTYNELDFTLVYKLITTFTLLPRPTQGWGKRPNNADLTISDDIERLRLIRNNIAHFVKADVSESEMKNYFSKMEEVAHRVDLYLHKPANKGFKYDVLRYLTCAIDYDLEQKLIQALKDIEQLKERSADKNILIYYGKSFEVLIQKIKSEVQKNDGHTSEKRKIFIIIENFQPNEQQIRILNDLKDKINEGQNLVEFVEASTGSLVLQVGVHDTAISSETTLAEVLSSFILRLLKFMSVEINDLEVLKLVLISEDDCSDIGLVVDTDGLESCFDSNISPGALQLEVNVDTDLFDSEQRLSSELAGLVGRVTKSNGNDSLSNVTAILTSDAYDDSRKVKLTEKVDDGISEFSFGDNSQFESTFLESDRTPKMSNFDVNKQDIVINIITSNRQTTTS